MPIKKYNKVVKKHLHFLNICGKIFWYYVLNYLEVVLVPNIKSAKKRVKVIEKKTLINQMHRTALKTAIKKFEAAVEAKDSANVKVLFNDAVKKLDQGVKQGIIHKNKAARKKSQLALMLAKISA